MKRGQPVVIVVLALFAGFIGGILSSQFLGDRTVFAREEPPAKEVLVAHEFRLVSDDGRILAILGGHPGEEPFLPIEPALRFFDLQGDMRLLVGMIPVNKPYVGFFDKNGKTSWEAK
jgi:hypothetical protein